MNDTEILKRAANWIESNYTESLPPIPPEYPTDDDFEVSFLVSELIEISSKIEKYEKALKWIAERGWNPHGTVSENSLLSYDCHCEAANALTKD